MDISNGRWWSRNWELLNGCSEVSPACVNCFARNYIRRFQERQEKWQGLLTPEGRWNGTVNLCPENLDLPFRTKKPTAWFVTERGDLFHENVPTIFIDRALEVMAACPQHTFLILTKRAHLLEEKLYGITEDHGCRELGGGDYLPNLWLGTTVENQEQADKRIPHLLKVPGKRFLSVEPMLGPVDLEMFITKPISYIPKMLSKYYNNPEGKFDPEGKGTEYRREVITPSPIHAVICGGESGPGARPMHPDWVRSLKDQCEAAGVPFFFKQWGEWAPESQADFSESPFAALSSRNATYHVWPVGTRSYRVGKKKAGHLLDGKEYIDLPWRKG